MGCVDGDLLVVEAAEHGHPGVLGEVPRVVQQGGQPGVAVHLAKTRDWLPFISFTFVWLAVYTFAGLLLNVYV